MKNKKFCITYDVTSITGVTVTFSSVYLATSATEAKKKFIEKNSKFGYIKFKGIRKINDNMDLVDNECIKEVTKCTN